MNFINVYSVSKWDVVLSSILEILPVRIDMVIAFRGCEIKEKNVFWPLPLVPGTELLKPL